MPFKQAPTEGVMTVVEGEHSTPAAPKKLSDRLYFADNLRTYLITLVVLHHLAIVYTGAGAFYYVEPTPIDQLALTVLVIFIAVNQAYFMGLLFLISGYFSPGSLERKGVRRFVKDRLIRLGIPLVVFFFVLNPIAAIGSYAMPASMSGITSASVLANLPPASRFWTDVVCGDVARLRHRFRDLVGCTKKSNATAGEQQQAPPLSGHSRVRPCSGIDQLLDPHRHTDRRVCSWLSDPVVPPSICQFLLHRHRCRSSQLATERSEVDGEGGIRPGAGRDNHCLSNCDQRRCHKCRRLRVLAGSAVYAVWDSTVAVRNVPRADHTLP